MIIKNHYKTITFSVYFLEENNEDTKMYRFLLPQILLKTNDDYKTEKAFRKQLQEYYDANFSIRSTSLKDNNALAFHFTFIHPDYVEDKNYFNDVFNFFYKTIFNRNELSKDLFDFEKRKTIELFESLKDNKNLYARERFFNEFFPHELNYLEKLTQIKELTFEDLSNYYQKMFETNITDYYISGNLDNNMIEIFINQFKNNNKKIDLTPKYLELKTPKTITEKLETSQTLIYLGYNIRPFTNFYNYEAEILTDYIIGGFNDSKLFKTIREEMGLCYSIRSSIDVNNATLTIHAGVSHDNKEKALNAIVNLIEDLKVSGITDEDLETAKKHFIRIVKEAKDSQIQIINYHYLNDKLNRSNDFEDKYLKINSVTKADVINIIKNLSLDTTYILESNNEEN